MEDLPHLIDRDLEQITESIRPENHDVPVMEVHFAGETERLLDVLALDAVPEGSPLVPHSVTVVAKSLHTRSLADISFTSSSPGKPNTPGPDRHPSPAYAQPIDSSGSECRRPRQPNKPRRPCRHSKIIHINLL